MTTQSHVVVQITSVGKSFVQQGDATAQPLSVKLDTATDSLDLVLRAEGAHKLQTMLADTLQCPDFITPYNTEPPTLLPPLA